MTGTVPAMDRWAIRDAQRQENARIAREASQARSRRPQPTIVERVEAAKLKLANVNAAGAVSLIQAVSPQDYDVYLLAEMYGQERKGVLRQFGAPRNTVETVYLAAAGLASPEYAPSEGLEE